MVLLPLIGLAVVASFRLEPEVAVGLMVLAFCPGGTTSNMYAYLFKGDVALSITLTALVSMLAPFTVPFFTHYAMLYLMGQANVIELPVLETIGQLIAITVVPVALGMIFRHYFPRLAHRAGGPVKYMSIAFLFLVIVALVLKNRDDMAQFFLLTGAATLVLNVVAMFAGFSAALLARLSREQAITVGFEVGIQNGTTALLVTGVILGVPAMTIAPVTYSLLMFGTGAIFGGFLRMVYPDLASATATAQNVPVPGATERG
jgi:BASS family bile acid:Na+ symporter